MRRAHSSFLSMILKRNGAPYSLKSVGKGPVQSGSCGPSVAKPTLMVECKEDLNASRALLVLEHNIKIKGVCV